MDDFIIGILATLLSTAIIGLWGVLVVDPFRSHVSIHKQIMRFIRNFEDPREINDQLMEHLKVESISRQINTLDDILDLIEEQKGCNKFVYWLFNYKIISKYLNILFEYIRNPIMLESQKRFDTDYILDSAKVFDLLRKKSKVFNWKMFSSLLVITMVLISIFVVAIYIVK